MLSHAGQVYKWVDESGNVQFSQFPPPGKEQSESLNIKVQKSSSASTEKQKLNDLRQKLSESSVDRNTESEDEKVEKEKQLVKAENCSKAKQKLLDYQNNGRIYKTLPNGEREWYDEKGRDQLIKQAEQEVSKYCS